MKPHDPNRAVAAGNEGVHARQPSVRCDQNGLTGPESRGLERWEQFWADALDRLKHHIEDQRD